MTRRLPDLRRILLLAVLCVGGVAGAEQLLPSHTASPFVAHALGTTTPSAPLARPMDADALQRVTQHGLTVSTHGQSVALALDGARGTWTRHANGVERTLPFGHESIVLTRLSTEELVTVERHLGTRTWQWRLDSSLAPTLKADGSVTLGTRLAILPVAILDAAGRNITPHGLHWTLARAHGATWLQLRLSDRSLPLPYLIDPNIALTGTCPNSAGQTDLSNQQTGSVVANGCSAATQSGSNGTTSLVMTAPTTLANGNVMIAQVLVRTNTAVTPPAGWTQIGTTQLNGTTLAQYLYYRVASGDTGGTTTWTWSIAAKFDMAGGIVAFSGVDNTNPVDAVSTSSTTGTGTTATAPAVTTTVQNDAILAFYASQAGVPMSGSTFGGAATTKYYSVASKANPVSNEADGAGAAESSLQSTIGSTGTSTASLSASQPWIAQTVALRTTGPTAITFNGSRTKASALSTWTVGFTATATGALTAGNTVTITFPSATWTGIPASPTVTFGGSFSGCSATTASTASSVVTVTLPAGCSLANSASGTIAIAGITNPAANTYTNTTFDLHTSSDFADSSPASNVVISAATTPTAITFAGSRTKASARATWTAGFTATASGSLSAGDTVTVTFPGTWSGIPASPAVTFGGSFAGCGAGATGSTASSVVTITLPAGCTLANSASGTVAIAGITNPAAATYTNTNFKVHTSSDATDASPASNVVISAATAVTAVSFSPGSSTYGASTTWTVGFTTTASGALAAGDVLTVTFDSGFSSGLPTSPAITFGGSFSGCGAGATGSTSSNVVTVTLPSGCTLANSAAGTVAIAGVTNPVPATYTSTNFKVHDTNDASDASPGSNVVIAKKNLTISGATASNKVYDAGTSATVNFGSATLSGIVGGDVVAIDSSAYSASFASKTVGTGKTVTVSGVALSGANAGNYTVSQPSGLTANITTATLTVTGVTANNKTYDATTSATLNTGSAALSGVLGSDTVTLGGTASGTFASKTVGNGKTVTVSGFTISGADSGNYTLTQPSPTANITTATLTVTGITASNKTYDRTTSATLNTGSAALSGVISGDAVTLSTASATGSFATATVGSGKTVTVSGLTISGADSGNYSLTQPTTTANITAATLTVTGVTASNKTYDQTTSATLNTGSAALSGVISGDTVTLGTGSATGSFATAAVGTGKTVTVAGLTISGADSGNYTLTQPTTTANITAKNLTVSGVTASNKTYDRTTAATIDTSGATLNGVISGDTVTLNTGSATGSFATATVGTGKTVTIAGLTISGADAANYTLTQPTTTANITAKTLTVSGVTVSDKIYDGGTSAALGGTATLNGVVGGDTVLVDTSAATGTFASAHVGTGISVAVSGITISGADAANYTLAQPTTTANITAKALTISGAAGNNRGYDGTTTATVDFSGASLNGVVGADSVSIDASSATFTFATKAVGTAKPITAGGVALTGTNASDYTVSQPTGLTANVTAKGLTITGVTANDKVYDGGTAAALSGTASLQGVVAGDTVNLGGTPSASFADKSVGSNKAVTVSGYTISGADAANYTVGQPSGLTASITAKGLTVTGVAVSNKVYDATTAATLNTGSASLSGVVGGDTVTLGGTATGSFASKAVGTSKTVTVAGFTLGGADAGDYTLTQPTTTANITPKPLTISGVTANDKVYDGTAPATLSTGGASLVGVVGGDTVVLDGSSAAGTFADKNAGNGKTVTTSGFALTGADAGNYTVTQPTTTASITKKNLTVAGAVANDKPYDGTTTASVDFTGASLNGVVGGDTVTLVTSAYSASFAQSAAGSGIAVTVSGVTLGGADAGNYSLSQPSGLTAAITGRPLSITGVTATNRVYDGTTSDALDTSSAALSGLVNGDDVTLVTSGATGTFASKDVGTGKTVTAAGFTITGADAPKYMLSQPTGLTANVTAKNVTVSGVTASDKIYDATTTATLNTGSASLVGVAGGDSVTLGGTTTGSFASKTVGANKTVTVAGFTLGGADAGDYTLTQPTTTASITAKSLTVTGVTANDKVYDAGTSAGLNVGSASLAGVLGGDTVLLDTSAATGTFASAHVGSGIAVAVSGIMISGPDAANYALSQPSSSASITARNLTIAGASGNDKVYDGTTAASVDYTGATLVGVQGSDSVSIDASSSSASFADRNVGANKAVTASGVALTGTDAANYTVSQPTGITASITRAPLTISGVTANDRVYNGGTAATLDTGSASLVGVVGGDDVHVAGTPSGAFGTKDVGANKPVTTSGFSLSGADAANYTLAAQPSTTASITAKALTISGVSANDKVYNGTTGATLDTSGATLVGVVGGDAVGIGGSPSASFANKHAGSNKAVTASGFALTGADAADYSLSQPSGLTASITQRSLTVTAQSDTKAYDTTTASSILPQVTSGSVAAGDTGNFTQAFATAAVGTNKTIVPSGSVADGNGGADYNVGFVNGTGTITPAAPAKLAFTQAPASASGGVAFATQPQVSVEDAYGNVITTDSATHVTLALGTNPSGATLACPTSTTTVTVSSGVAAFAGCRLDKQGTGYTLTTTNDAGLTDATSGAFDVVVGTADAANSTVSGPATVVADGSTAGTVTVTLKDTGDNAVAGKTVTLAQDSGKHATIAPASAVTDSNGRATFSVRDQTQEPVTFTATDVDDSVTVTQTATVSFEDHTPPTATIGAPADGVQAAGNLVLSATGVADGETGIQDVSFQYCHGTCQTIGGSNAGGGTWTATLDTTTLTTGQSYTWSATATDKAGNSTTTGTRTFSVDNSPPVVAFAAPTLDTPAIEYYDGAAATPTLWLNASGTGSFELNATAADPQSGIAKVHFPALLGTPAHDVTGSSPYQSQTYSFTNQSSNLTGNSIVATNGVTAGDGVNTASTAFDVKVDGAGPTATMSAGLNGKAVSSGVLVGAASADAGSGVHEVAFVYCDRTANPVCNPNLAIGTASSPTLGSYEVAWTMSGLVDGHQYAVAAVSTDNVGNATTSAAVTVTVDNSAPAVAFLAPTTSGDAYFDGTKLFVKATGTGSYTLHAHATDAQSGIASVLFGSDAGTPAGGGDYDSPSYPIDGSAATMTVTATNGVQLPAGLTASDQLQRVADATVPATGVQFPANNGGYDTNTWPTGSQACSGSQPEGLCGTVSDTGSGVKTVKLTLQDLGGGNYYDGSSFQPGVTTLTVVPSGNTWSYPLDHSKLGTGTYELKVYATDNVGNVETTQTIDFQFGSDLTPPDTQLTLTNATHASLALVGTHASPNAGNDYDLYYSTAGSGGFKLHAVSTDVSGIDHITFPAVFGTGAQTSNNGGASNPWTVDSPAYAFGSGDTTPPAQAVVTSVDTAIPHGNSGDDTITFLVDNTAPTGGSIGVGPVDGNGYATTTSLTVSHVNYTDGVTGSGLQSSALTVASAGLSNGTCGTFGSDTPVADGGFAATNGTCYRFTLIGTDNVGNVATTTQIVKVDSSAPSTPTVAFSGLSAGNTYDDGAGTLWYRPSAGGAFTVTASSTDAESGVSGYTFSSLLGGTQTGGQLAVTFGSGGIGSGTYTVKASNRASLDSPTASFTVNADSTAPAGGALKVNGTDATAVPTSSYLTAGSSVSIDSRSDYTDAGSGIATSTLTMETGTLAHNGCSAWGAPATIAGTTAQSVSNGHCYRFTLTGSDHVGNTASISTVVMVDTTAPTTTGVIFSGLSAGNTYDDGHGTLWYRPSTGGAFVATLTGAADPETDVAGYTFSPLAGFTSTSQTGNALHVTFDGSSSGGGSFSGVATNNAGVDSAPAPFTVTADTTAPAGGLLSIAPYSGSLAISIGEADFGDAGSGIAGNALTRSNPVAPSAGSCPGSGYSGATPVAVSGGAATDTVPTDGRCYEYTLTGTDRVGNSATYKAIVLVDTTPPTGGTVDAPDGPTSLPKISVDWNAGSDAESGISTVDVQRAESTFNGSACDPLGGFTTIVTNASTSPVVDSAVSVGNCYQYRIVVTNRAGVQATFTSSAVTQLTNASPFALSGSPTGAYLSGSTLYVAPSPTTFGVELNTVGQSGVTSADWSAGTGTVTGTPSTASTPPYASATYTWAGSPGGTISVTRQPTNTVDTLNVVADTTAPSGSIDYVDGVNASHSVVITTSANDGGGSGVDATSEQVLRSETSLTGSTCDTANWTAFAPISLSGGADTSVADNHCYRYEYAVADNVGNSATFTSPHVAQIPDITPPTFASAATDASGTHLAITMSEPLDAGSVPSASQFTVFYNGVAQADPTSVQIVGSTVVLGLASPPNNSQTVTVRYASDGSLRDRAVPTPNATANFGPVGVTNNTPDTVAPSLASADVDGTTLTLHFDEQLAGNAPGAGAFSVTVHGVARTVTAVALNGTTATLTLDPAVGAGEAVVVHYAVPALDALHDPSGNTVAAFTSSVTNNTAAPVPPPPTTTPVSPAPFLVSATPADGSTVTAVTSFTLTADQSVTWTGMTLTRPDGSVTALADGSGATATYTTATTAQGLYVVHGTITAGGVSADVLTHFTIWTAPATGTAVSPPVEKNAGGSPDSALSGDGTVIASWTASTFGGEPVVIQVAPKTPASLSLPVGTIAVDVTAFMRDTHAPVTQLGDVLDVQFPHAPAGSHPQQSQDAKTWHDIPALPTLQLPPGQGDGWFRDSDGTVHVLTRHLTYFALLVPATDTKLALKLTTPRRLWLAGRTYMAVRILVTTPARVTGNFVAADGTVIPGQVIKTPTRRAGATILRVPLRVTKPGLYRLQVHAEGAGQTADRTARIRFLARRPAPTASLRVAVVRGLSVRATTLGTALGHKYVVSVVNDADLYTVVNPVDPRAATAVIVDLDTVPLASLVSLHLLLPELRIIGVAHDAGTASAARAHGIATLVVRHMRAPAVAGAITRVLAQH
jgi:hypothetical protein